MVDKFLFKLESLIDSPFISLKSEGVPIIGDLIGAGASMYNTETTNNTNARNVAKTNEMNYQIAQEANQLSQQQFQTNLNWLKQQYFGNQQREDTRYQRLVQDMMAAGLNPALQNGQPSSVSSVGAPSPSQFHVAQMEAAQVDPMSFDFLGSGLFNAVNSYFLSKKTKAETDKIYKDSQAVAIDNSTRFLENVHRINNLIADTEKKLSDKSLSDSTRSYYETQNDMLKEQLDILRKQAPALSVQPEKNNRVLDTQADEAESRTALNKIEAQFKPALLSANIKLSQSHSASLMASAAQAWEAAKTYYDTRHEIMPLEKIEHILTNGVLALSFNGNKSYESFVNDNGLSEIRSAIKILGELLHNLKPGMK